MREKRTPSTVEKRALQRVFSKAGNQKTVAAYCLVQQPTVARWLTRGYCPAERVLQLERLTDFKVKRYELRPDIYPPNEYRIVSIILQMSSCFKKIAICSLKSLLKEQQNRK